MKELLEKQVKESKERQAILIAEFKKKDNVTMLDKFVILTELLRIGKIIDVNYSIRELADDVDYSEHYLYRVMLYRYATDKTKKLVLEDKISFNKVIAVLKYMGDKNCQNDKMQNNAIKVAIKQKMSRLEIEQHFNEDNADDLTGVVVELVEEKDSRASHIIVRDINNYCFRLNKVLKSIDKVPQNNVKDIKANLVDLRDGINVAIQRLK